MPSDRVKRQIDALLDRAELAVTDMDWERVRDASLSVLAVDEANEDATAFLAMAEPHLPQQNEASANGSPASTPVISTPATSATETPESFADGRYVVSKFLGEGGKKKVYLARDTVLDRDIAFALIKMEGLDDIGRTRITREAQAMGRLGTHPNVVAVLDIGEHEGQPWMVNELLGGGDVEELIEDAEGPLNLSRALQISIDTLRGLQFAHEKGIIHRDIKPANVWMTDDGTAKVGDYGLAIATDRSRLTQEKMMVGTVSYMPPEQATGGEITPKADLYSLGAMLYEMVTGRPPFVGDDDIAIIGQHINTPPVSPGWHNQSLPQTLDSLIMRLLSKNPAERPDSADDVVATLEAIDTGSEQVAGGHDGTDSASLESMAGGVFVGRHKEVDQLKAKFENSLSGRGGMVALVGEPGIGKTRTSLELETYAGLRNAQVLWGRCYEGSGAPPYWPWVQAIRSYLTNHEPDELRQQMGSTASVISEIVTDVKDRLPDVQKPTELDDPESARFRLFDSIATFLKNAGQVKPIVLILDDLHWADKPSLMLLEFVARELASSRVMIVGTYRDMELNRRHPLAVTLGDLTRERLFERVLLRGLTRADVARFVEIAAGVPPANGLVDAIHTQTEGNPLFVTETVRLLIQEGEFAADQSSRSDSSWNIRIPEGVREVIGRRLDKLSERCNDILTTASIIGRVFTLDQIRAVSEETSEGQLLDVIDEALAARAIEEMPGTIGEYQFTHALIQETLSGELSTTRRVRLHAAIAVALESLWGDNADENATQLAEHFAEAETVLGSEKLVHYLDIAGKQGLDAYGYEEAQRAFERALRAVESAPVTPQIASLWHGLGRAQGFTLGRQEMQAAVDSLTTAFNSYIELGLTQKAVSVGFVHLPNVHGPEGMAKLIERAIELVQKGTADHARLLGEYVKWISLEALDHAKVSESVDTAIKIAADLGDSALELQVTASAITPISAVHGVNKALNLAKRAVQLSAVADVPGSEVVARESVGAALLYEGDFEAGMAHANAAIEAAERSRNLFHLVAAYSERAQRYILTGDWERAAADLDVVEVRDPNEVRILVARLQISIQIDDHPKVMEYLNKLWDMARADVAISLARGTGWRSAVVYSYMLGRNIGPPDIEQIAAEAFGFAPVEVVDAVGWSQSVLESKILMSLLQGDTDDFEQHYEALQKDLGTISTRHYRTRQLNKFRMMGLISTGLGKYDRAADDFETAIEMDAKIGVGPELAWTRYEYAGMLLKRDAPGDQDKANQLQDEAIAVSRELGMNLLLERVLSQREILKA